MAIVMCDGSTCAFHRFGACVAPTLDIRNIEHEGLGDEQVCKSYVYNTDWRKYDSDYEEVDGQYVYKGREKNAKSI